MNTEPAQTEASKRAVTPAHQIEPAHTCAKCAGEDAGAKPHHIYAIGSIEPRFPNLSLEKEYLQVTGRSEVTGKTERESMAHLLAKRENRYIARNMCWVMSVGGVPSYILYPADPADVDLLVGSLREHPRPTDIDLVVGVQGPIAPPSVCNGLLIPVVLFEQIYSFDLDGLVASIPRPDDIPKERFDAIAEEVVGRMAHMIDNAGATEEHRALNYLVVRYPRIYALAAELCAKNSVLSGVETRPTPIAGTRRLLDVIFSFTNRSTDVVEKHFARVDVTDTYPFLSSKLAPYFDR